MFLMKIQLFFIVLFLKPETIFFFSKNKDLKLQFSKFSTNLNNFEEFYK